MAATCAVAMLGYALRFPGAANVGEFWQLLADARDAVSVVPADRWDADEFFDPDPDAPGKMVTRRAGFVDDVAGFDAPFFGVSVREAMFMDPQHRLMLETTWSALEHAGIAPSSLAGTQTGVFMGVSTHEFAGMIVRLSRLEDIDYYSGTGCSAAAGAGRISYRLGLQGPAVVIDTACSSSLVALHQACQSLHSGDCDLALVGGVNVILTPIPMINFSRAHMLAPDGRCKTFDAAADGYVRGEGCGVVVLKRLDDALRDGDPPRALIRGTAVNQDGASGGLTVPSGHAQQDVITTALRRAGVDAAQVDYLEAHGTGTSLGDPIELQAAGAVFGDGRAVDRPLLVGSVKTNIGHLEAASGIAGLIKVALALEHEVLPKHLHFTEPSPYIPWDRLSVRVVDEATPWQRSGRPRIAGVSSFGFSGTNAHVVVEEAPAIGTPSVDAGDSRPGAYRLLPLSARTAEALTESASRYRHWMDANPDVTLADICATAGRGRSHFEHRAALVVDSRARARRLLGALHEDRPAPGLIRGSGTDRPKTAWLFPGQGSQFPGMARRLFESEPVFREAMQRCADTLADALPRPLLEVIFDTSLDGEEVLRDTTFAQPALFAVEIALSRWWQSWGIEPDVVVGHSVGQYVAACVAGVFSVEDGARLIAERGRLFGSLPPDGAMLAVFTDRDRVEDSAAGCPRLSVAAYNGASTVLSGPAGDIDRAAAAFSQEGIRCEPLRTSHAFHSALLEPVLDEFESYAATIDYSPPQMMLVCNRTGEVLTPRSRLDAEYWRRHARQPVRFADSVATLAGLGCTALMELGPQPVLTAAAIQAWPGGVPPPHTITSLTPKTDDLRCLTEALATAYTCGHQLDFAARTARPSQPVDLPTYPFQHRSYWFPAYTAPDLSGRARAGATWPGDSGAPSHPPAADQDAGRSAGAAASDWLLDEPPESRRDRILDVVVAGLAEALHTTAGEIDSNAEFASLGVDSLTAMDLRRRLQASLGIEISASLCFAHPTAAALAEGLLAAWLQHSADPDRRPMAIPRLTADGELPLSHAQEQLWFLHELLPSSSAYNVAARIDIPGAVDHHVLQQSFDVLMERHQALRTTFRSMNGVPRAVLAAPRPFDLPLEELREGDIAAATEREAAVSFDIAVGPPVRARLFRMGGRHALVVTMHHIVTDGWSFRILLRDLGMVYRALERGQAVPLSELPIQYHDYAQWQREQLCGAEFESHLDFWRADLAGAPPLELESDRPRPKTPSFRGARTHFALGSQRAAALRALCRAENLTISVPLLSACAAVLARYSGQDDIVIGTLTANRAMVETEDVIGLFVNALPLRIRLDGDPDGAESLRRIHRRMVDVLAHQDVPFNLIVNATAATRAANRNPLFSVQLVVQPAAGGAELSGLGLEVTEIDTHTAKRDLTFTFFDDDVLTGHVEYAADLFDAVRIDRMIEHFTGVLDATVSDLGLRLSELPILSESESSYYRVNPSPYPRAAGSVPELFERTVDRVPDAVAVTAGRSSLTYRELDAAANRLARRLRSRGVAAGTAVGLCVGRTMAMPIGMLGILKAGGVYVPIDPSSPKRRVEAILDEAGVSLLLGDEDVLGSDVHRECLERPEIYPRPDDLAYIMYTSGSTGRPKGVAVSHAGVVEYTETLGRELGIGRQDVYLETASISFSSSIRQILVPLAVGAHVVFADDQERGDPVQLLRRITESEVTVADLVPTVVRALVDAAANHADRQPTRLRLLLTASEPLRVATVRAWRHRFGSDVTWINMYGQTETTGIVSLHRVDEPEGADQSIVPIGRPRDNVCLYVLDRSLRPVPPGISGELFIAGTALATGYIGDPELTAGKFVCAPWDPNERLYASGDVVRLSWDGTIEYRSRTDRQVKIRGLRVEPAEIDRVLLEYPGVDEAVTVAHDADTDAAVLVAYFAPSGGPVSVSELRSHARRHLPEHMVPSAFKAMDRLPQTSNGKLDVANLPDVSIGRDEEVAYIAPRGEVEEAIAGIWSELLHVEPIGAADNFFAIGGHSLLAAQVRSRVHQRFGVSLPLDALFDDQTLADLARRVEDGASAVSEAPPLRRVSRRHEVPVSYAQEAMWRAEQEEPGSAAHWIDVSVRIVGPLNPALIVHGIQRSVARNELLRTTFRPADDPTPAGVLQVIDEARVPDVPVRDGATDTQAPDEPEWHDLDARPPFRADVTRVADDHHVLRLRAHRIIADGYSMRLLLSEIGGTVAGSLASQGSRPPDHELQYADYASWERSWLTGEALSRRVGSFLRECSAVGLPPALPTDHPRTGRPNRRGDVFDFELPREVAAAARSLAATEHASLYSVLLAAFATAVGRYAEQRAVVIAAPLSRRTDPVTQQMIGPFMNTVPLLIEPGATGSLRALIQEVKMKVREALSNQDAPWHHVRAALTEQHGARGRAVGELVFLMDDPVPAELAASGLVVSRVPPERIVLRRELTVAISTRDQRITGTVTYDASLFERGSIAAIVSSFVATLAMSQGVEPQVTGGGWTHS